MSCSGFEAYNVVSGGCSCSLGVLLLDLKMCKDTVSDSLPLAKHPTYDSKTQQENKRCSHLKGGGTGNIKSYWSIAILKSSRAHTTNFLYSRGKEQTFIETEICSLGPVLLGSLFSSLNSCLHKDHPFFSIRHGPCLHLSLTLACFIS